MKISEAIVFCLQYQEANSRNNTIKNYEFILGIFGFAITGSGLGSIKKGDVSFFGRILQFRQPVNILEKFLNLRQSVGLMIFTHFPPEANQRNVLIFIGF